MTATHAADKRFPGLEFANDEGGRLLEARCTREPTCTHRFVPHTSEATHAAAIYVTALRSDHWQKGCSKAAPQGVTPVEPDLRRR